MQGCSSVACGFYRIVTLGGVVVRCMADCLARRSGGTMQGVSPGRGVYTASRIVPRSGEIQMTNRLYDGMLALPSNFRQRPWEVIFLARPATGVGISRQRMPPSCLRLAAFAAFFSSDSSAGRITLVLPDTILDATTSRSCSPVNAKHFRRHPLSTAVIAVVVLCPEDSTSRPLSPPSTLLSVGAPREEKANVTRLFAPRRM